MFRTQVWQKQELYARDPQQQLDSLHLWVGGYGISVLSPIKQQQLPGGSTTNHMPSLPLNIFLHLSPGEDWLQTIGCTISTYFSLIYHFQWNSSSSEDQLQTTCLPLNIFLTSFSHDEHIKGLSQWIHNCMWVYPVSKNVSVIKSSDLFETLQPFPPLWK